MRQIDYKLNILSDNAICSMEGGLTNIIHVKKYRDKINLSAEVLSILNLPTDGVLWRKTDNEYYLFSKKQRGIFVQEMKDKKGMTEVGFNYTKKGRQFVR